MLELPKLLNFGMSIFEKIIDELLIELLLEPLLPPHPPRLLLPRLLLPRLPPLRLGVPVTLDKSKTIESVLQKFEVVRIFVIVFIMLSVVLESGTPGTWLKRVTNLSNRTFQKNYFLFLFTKQANTSQTQKRLSVPKIKFGIHYIDKNVASAKTVRYAVSGRVTAVLL